jgi:uncharacterized protein YajQ (UPF0234 family)
MAQDFSFDIVSEVNQMEVKNAFNAAEKELSNRYDFKGSPASMEMSDDGVTLTAEDEFRMDQVRDILISKLLKRNIDIRMIENGKVEPAGGMVVKQKVTFKKGIPQDKAKALVKAIKDQGLKVQAQIQGDAVRVSAKSKDDLQKCISAVKAMTLEYAVDFTNYR